MDGCECKKSSNARSIIKTAPGPLIQEAGHFYRILEDDCFPSAQLLRDSMSGNLFATGATWGIPGPSGTKPWNMHWFLDHHLTKIDRTAKGRPSNLNASGSVRQLLLKVLKALVLECRSAAKDGAAQVDLSDRFLVQLGRDLDAAVLGMPRCWAISLGMGQPTTNQWRVVKSFENMFATRFSSLSRKLASVGNWLAEFSRTENYVNHQ